MAATLQSLLGGEPKVEKVIEGLAGADGPVYSRRGYLLFSDVPARRIMKSEGGQPTAYRTDSNGAAGLSFDHEGRLLACEANRITRTEKNEDITVLTSNNNAPADVVYAIDGSIYFTDGEAVHQITSKGVTQPVSQECRAPHGVALSPTQQKLYVSDASSRNIRVHDVQANGLLRTGHVFASVPDTPKGLKTDEDGDLWVATAKGVSIFDPAGALLDTITTPEPATSCCWGEGFRDLYLTAGTSVFKISTKIVGTRTF